MIEMATGLPPFPDYTPVAAMFKVGRERAHPEYPDLAEPCRAFLDLCFMPEPQDRHTAAQVGEREREREGECIRHTHTHTHTHSCCNTHGSGAG